MAALTLKPDVTFDYAGLAKHCIKNLPVYAVPVFLRILPECVLFCSRFAVVRALAPAATGDVMCRCVCDGVMCSPGSPSRERSSTSRETCARKYVWRCVVCGSVQHWLSLWAVTDVADAADVTDVADVVAVAAVARAPIPRRCPTPCTG
jgi:hypothetical protein